MHKLNGRFDTKDFSLNLAFDKAKQNEKDIYDEIKSYYTGAMFVRYTRRSPNFQRIVISSIGDHLDEEDNQDVAHADLFLDIEVLEKVSKNMQDILSKAPNWLVTVNLFSGNKVVEEFCMLIRKADEFIVRHGDY